MLYSTTCVLAEGSTPADMFKPAKHNETRLVYGAPSRKPLIPLFISYKTVIGHDNYNQGGKSYFKKIREVSYLVWTASLSGAYANNFSGFLY